jgi:hypothetical protein
MTAAESHRAATGDGDRAGEACAEVLEASVEVASEMLLGTEIGPVVALAVGIQACARGGG